MFASRLSASKLITKRLDADFYRPEYLECEAKLLSKDVCSLGSIGHFFAGPFGSLLPSHLYLESGVPLFRVGNVGQFEVLTDNLAHLSPEIHNELKTSEVRPGDLLVVKASVGEKICKVPDWITKANITQHIIGIRLNGNFDTDFVAAFLFSSFGVKQLQRYSLGSIIQYLGISDAKSALIVKTDLTVQKYIGDKIRQAEQLRAWAKRCLRKIDGLSTNDLIDASINTISTRYNHPQISDLTHRLDPKYYNNRAIAVHRQVESLGQPLAGLILSITNGFEERAFVKDGVDYVTVTEVSSGRLELSSAPKISAVTGIPQKAKINKRCVLVVRTGSIGTAIKIDRRDSGAAISSHLIRLEFTDEETAAAVAVFLNSPAGKILQHKISYGAVQPQIGQDELTALPIPDFVLNEKRQILELLTAYENAIRASIALVTASKQLVESLIEGQINESQLVAAQEALASSDNSLDRDILFRLKVDGSEGEGDPLFPDIDRLYDLLDQAKRALAE